MRKRRVAFRIWAKALGEKASHRQNEADLVALVRTFIFCTYFATNLFIVAGVIRHWNGPRRVVDRCSQENVLDHL